MLYENLSDLLILDDHGPLKTQGMSSVRILWSDGTVVVLSKAQGEKNIPALFGWLSVSTGFITD